MCELLKLFASRDLFVESLRISLQEAQSTREDAMKGAIYIQRCYRGKLARDKILFKSQKANEIQRVFRGHLGRTIYRSIKKQKRESIRFMIVNFFALQLQRIFRGFYSRKYRQNYARRRNFIKSLEDRGNQVRDMQYKYAIEQAQREEQESIEKKNREFQELSRNMHHLVSTKTIRGVLNPDPAFIEPPTINGVYVEDHVRGVVKDLLRTRGISKTKSLSATSLGGGMKTNGLVPDHNGTMKIPLKGLQNKLSIQASTPYSVVEEEKRREKAISRLLISLTHKPKTKLTYLNTLNQTNTNNTNNSNNNNNTNNNNPSMIPNDYPTFTTGGKVKKGDRKTEFIAPLCVDDPYVDLWANPMLKRGVPTSQEQFNLSCSTRKALFLAPVENSNQQIRPFVTKTGGNKSTALPNDLFDVIADAEVTGGTVHRHLGTSVRFGVPDNSDFRPVDGPVPPPPIRTTTIRPSRSSRTKKYSIPVRSMGGGTVLRTQGEGGLGGEGFDGVGDGNSSVLPYLGWEKIEGVGESEELRGGSGSEMRRSDYDDDSD